MTNAETLSYLPQETLERWIFILSIAYQVQPNEGLKEIAGEMNQALWVKQNDRIRGYEETKTELGI